HNITARLLVIEPKRRWQVMLDWQAQKTSGRARLVHAASGNIVELRWQKDDIQLRDNHAPNWRKINMQQLAEHGIVISPYTLSRFLAGHIPAGFHRKNANTWESTRDGKLIRVIWQSERKQLIISDIRHGRRATLMINKTTPSVPDSSGAIDD
ncbi:MAG: hypothetical protein Q9M25_01395, partial [Mariprofundaceae bacterium]|nr:hypothetical protein [Mariprofundaceae bacterium]